jgi:hypothetical protein
MCPGECGQQGRVNIHDLHGKSIKKQGGQNPHETSHHDKAYLMRFEDVNHLSVEVFPRPEILMPDNHRRDMMLPAALEGVSIRIIADDHFDFGIKASILNAVNNGLKIGAAAGYQNTDA